MKRHMIILSILCLSIMTLRAQDTTAVCPVLPNAQIRQNCFCGCHNRPVNDYDGLNSLKARLANPKWNGSLTNINTGLKLEDGRIKPLPSSIRRQEPESPVTSSGINAGENEVLLNPYLAEVGRGEMPIGAPIYVFFRLAGTHVTDSPQLLSVNAAAELAMVKNLRVRITGAADSATGSSEKNASLAMERARHVSILMKERGVPEDRIEIRAEGGTGQYSPVSANRNCRIELFLE